jgi:hypothetical protein
VSFLCIDHVPDLVQVDAVADQAVRINPANARGHQPGTGLEAAGDRTFFWSPGTVLKVRFLDGSPALHDRVMAAASDWTDHAYLQFVVVDDGDSDIRVTFGGGVNESALGTKAAAPELFGPDDPTMWLAEVPSADPDRAAGICRHEFGHAIGLIHEHSSPEAGIKWNKPQVYHDLAGPPNYWKPEDVEFNVFQRYATVTTQYTAFDPASVMLYPIPPGWTLDGLTVPENRVLSATDKAFVTTVYPQPQ